MSTLRTMSTTSSFVQRLFCVSWCVLLLHNFTTALPETIYIGALLEDDREDREQELALRYAIDRINNNNAILPASRLRLLTQRLPPGDAFHAFKTVCSLVEKGARAVLSLQSSQAAAVVRSACARFHVPFLRVRRCDDGADGGHPFALSFYPDPEQVGKALLDLVLALDWTSFTLVYRNQSSFLRLREVLKYGQRPPAKVRLVQCPDQSSYDAVLKDLRRKRELRVLLDLSTAEINAFMKKAVKGSMATSYHQYILTSMDLHTLSWWRPQTDRPAHTAEARSPPTSPSSSPASAFTPAAATAGVYGFRLLDADQAAVHDVIREWNFGELLFGRRVGRTTLRTENALIYDAVSLLARSFHDLDRSQSIDTHRLSCWDPDAQGPWPHGRALVSYMKMVQFNGLTGDVRLGDQGRRKDFTLEMMKLQSDGFQKVGTWTGDVGLTAAAQPEVAVPRSPTSAPSLQASSHAAGVTGKQREVERSGGEPRRVLGDLRQRRLLRVTTIVRPPYVIARGIDGERLPPSVNGSSTSSARVRYTGFAVQLLDMVASALGIEYEIRASADGSDYGTLSAREGRWSGLVREVFEREADLAIGDITITRERLEYVDFTTPFLQNDLGVLYRNIDRDFRDRPAFLRPWTAELWLCTATAALASSLALAFASRLSAAEWVPASSSRSTSARRSTSCAAYRKAPRRVQTLRNRFTLADSLWFILGSLLQQGTEVFPKALATRIMAVVWWLFALVLITSYTASLASQIIAQHLQAPLIQSIGDLSKQSKINYGCVTKSVARGLLKESTDPHLQRVWSTMEMSGPHAFFDSVSTAVVKVREEGFAVLMDSQTIEYLVAHDCSLMQLPGRLKTGGFGFAMPQGSPLRHLFTNKILQLQENGTLHALRQRWWSSLPDDDQGADRRCNPTVDGTSSAPGSANGSGNKDVVGIRGLLLVLGIGCLVSLAVVIAECLWRFRCSSKRRNQGPKWRKARRSIPTSLSLQESNLIILDPPKEFQDDHESCPMTSYKCETPT